MKQITTFFALLALIATLFSCTPDLKDFEAREAELAKKVEKIDLETLYVDIMMLYFDVIEDVYNEGKETGEFDLARIEAMDNGLMKDFQDKIPFQNEVIYETYYDNYDASLKERIETISPMFNEMFKDANTGDENQPEILEDGSIVIRNDTIKELDNGKLLINGDTTTYEEYFGE